MLISNYKTTIRKQNTLLKGQKLSLDEEQIDNIVEKAVPSLNHVKEIYYYLCINNWFKAKGITYNYI